MWLLKIGKRIINDDAYPIGIILCYSVSSVPVCLLQMNKHFGLHVIISLLSVTQSQNTGKFLIKLAVISTFNYRNEIKSLFFKFFTQKCAAD